MTQLALMLLPPLLIMVAAAATMRWLRFDTKTMLPVLLALCLCLGHILNTTWRDFTVDADAHMMYVDFIHEHQRIPGPLDHAGGAARHPPAYYVAAERMIAAGEALGVADPKQWARYVSFACYAMFLILGVCSFRLVMDTQTKGYSGYYCAVWLLAFWPLGITMSGRVTCDLLLYVAFAGSIYSTLCWLKNPAPKSLAALFWWAGLGEMAKNMGVLLLVWAIAVSLWTLFKHRKEWREFLRPNLILALIFTGGSHLGNASHGWIIAHEDSLGIYYHWGYLWRKLTSFNLFLWLLDIDMGLSQDSFWNMWVHTIMLGDGALRWRGIPAQLAILALWLAVIAYSVVGLIQLRRAFTTYEKSSLLFFAGLTAVIIVSALYMLLRSANPNYMDARYAYPSVIGIALLPGLVIQRYIASNHMKYRNIGVIIVAGFVFSVYALFMFEFVG